MTLIRWSFILAASVSFPLTAAPPKVTHLFPSGARQGATVDVQIVGAVESWPPGIHVGGTGLAVAVNGEKGKLSVKVDADASPGVRWIRVFNAEGTAPPRPFVIGTIDEALEVEPNDALAQATAVQGCPVTLNGRLGKSGDVDAFAVKLERGETLIASLDAFRRLKSPMDAVLQVVSAAGFVLAQSDDDAGFDPLIAFTAPEGGRFLVRLFAFPAQPDSTIGFAGGADYIYRLTLTTGPFADYLFPLAVALGKDTECAPTGWNELASAPRLHLGPFEDANRIDVQPLGLVCLTPVRVTPFPLLVESGATSRSEPQEIPFPSALSGRIDPPGDVDVFRVRAAKGQRIRISVESRSLGRPLDPALRALDKAGKSLAEADDAGESRDPELTVNVPDDGEVLVELEDLHHRGGWRFAYALLVGALAPDFQISVGSDSLALAAGKPFEVGVSVDRKDGFDRELEIAATDLPPGLAAAPAKSAPQGDSAKSVKLALTASTEARPWNCPIHIIARTTSEPAIERSARVWLTVLPPAAPAKGAPP